MPSVASSAPGPKSGTWASRGSVLASGAPGKRYALPKARVLLHQPHSGVEGQSPTSRSTRRRSSVSAAVRKRSSRSTPQPLEKVRQDTNRDFILTAEEAKAYGVVDEVVTDRKLRFARA